MDSGIKPVDRFNQRFGEIISYLILAIIAIVVYEVVMRKLFRAPTEWAFDVTIYLYGTHFVLSFGYCLLHRGHVRVDVIYQQFRPSVQTWLRIVTFFLLFLPFVGFLTFASWDYAIESWMQLERGQSTWRPPIFIVKSMMPIGMTLLLLQGVSNMVADIRMAKQKRTALDGG
jgi:TRAP-type mannitol/chloroaromatic compound transport system permease small subunit